jgi:ribokinase
MILSIGDLVVDITIVPEGTLRVDDDNPARIRIGGGGQAANFCSWTASLGEAARLITRVGDDDSGHRLVGELRGVGVEVRPIYAPEPTGVIAVLVDPAGKRTMATQRGASIGLRANDLREEWFSDVRLIHVPAYSLFLEPLASASMAAIELVRREGGALSVDLSSPAGLKAYGGAKMAGELERLRPDLLFVTEPEAEALGVPVEDLERLAKVPVIKLGSAGCSVFGDVIPAPRRKGVDPTGAGDAFAAAFCVFYLKGAPHIEAARKAVELASQAAAQMGARP